MCPPLFVPHVRITVFSSLMSMGHLQANLLHRMKQTIRRSPADAEILALCSFRTEHEYHRVLGRNC